MSGQSRGFGVSVSPEGGDLEDSVSSLALSHPLDSNLSLFSTQGSRGERGQPGATGQPGPKVWGGGGGPMQTLCPRLTKSLSNPPELSLFCDLNLIPAVLGRCGPGRSSRSPWRQGEFSCTFLGGRQTQEGGRHYKAVENTQLLKPEF